MIVFLDKFVDPTLTLDRILRNCFGLNRRSTDVILSYTGLKGNITLENLTFEQLVYLEDTVSQNFKLNEQLSNELAENKEAILLTGSVRAFRHENRLPTRGQRTHSNGQTRKKRG